MQGVLAALLNSLEIGLLLAVIAAGLNIVFGVLGVINFAHGSLYMLGAYFAFALTSYLGLSFWPALLLAPLAVAVVAVVIEKLALQHVYGRDIADSLLITFALLLVIDDAVRIVWGAGIHVVPPPAALRGTVELFGALYPRYSLFVIVAALLAMAGLWLFFLRTRAGRIVRAAAIDRRMAEAVGINVPLVITGVFALGAWMAGIAGVIAAPMRAIVPAMGDRIIIDAFIVVVIGGLGSFPGTLLGALILGGIYGFGGRYLPQINLVLPYLGMALVLLLRPRGLAGREAA
ncbi:branched-chain amino acid ABC transporter permease [Ottowia sp.]|uniref:branched-chain amino acid ABC transporter permease n=1 Tax=Ottowia sp. TaxID=1898956 RepID=UPI002BEA625D|nr:branched-chain amino acid ABC transporter permease [Ottowia sp.]HRN76977.1 branched-chain amino acid ABC transporter permease [Ottowia sp.]HRQ04097.1 branched-chain amino acid ABC transporter permease [Ottowia sp.]